jgi:outer membrane protein OmpA-like peptidoglycan-associated protein
MSDSIPKSGDDTEGKPEAASNRSIEALHDLIVGPTRHRLEGLAQQIEDPERHAGAVSRVLPRAITLGTTRDNQLATALEPILENTIRTSIKRDRRILVDALFPVMGPAIRKAIASTIQGLIQNFNQVLEHSVSLRGLSWRLEALRTRRPFAEVVLLNTLVYQVEQVFLIHRESGLLVEHVVTKTAAAQNPDLVSGMLTAIKDFVQESFGAALGETLDTFQVGECKVWIEHSAYAVLAAVIRGNPPVGFKEMMRDALDEIHLKHSDALSSFEGDCESFQAARPILKELLQVQFKNQKKKSAAPFWVAIAAVALLLGWGVFHHMMEERRWRQLRDQLRDQPGIVVTQMEQQDGRRHVYGLKDPYAPDPGLLLEAAEVAREAVVFHWEPYLSAHPEFTLRRAERLLAPPSTIRLSFQQGELQASGAALPSWIDASRRLVRATPWIDRYDDDKVVDIDARLGRPSGVKLSLEGTTLKAEGRAGHAWIAQSRSAAVAIPGVEAYDDARLIDVDVQAWDTVSKTVAGAVFYFEPGRDTLVRGQEKTLEAFQKAVNELVGLSQVLNRTLHIEVVGHADQIGSETFNVEISRKRAEAFSRRLMDAGMQATAVSIHAAGSGQPVVSARNSTDRALNRRVVFKLNPPGH